MELKRNRGLTSDVRPTTSVFFKKKTTCFLSRSSQIAIGAWIEAFDEETDSDMQINRLMGRLKMGADI